MIRRETDEPHPPSNQASSPAVNGEQDREKADVSADAPAEQDAALQAEPVAPPPHEHRPGEARETTPLQSIGQVVLQIVVGLTILGASLAATFFLVSRKTAPAQVPQSRMAPVVVVQRIEVGNQPVVVNGYGSVRATNQLALVPQVAGQVVEVHPGLVAGGTIPAGATVLRIDPTDYQLALRQAEADLQRAEAGLRRIESRRRSAEAEVARTRTALSTTLAEAEVAQEEYRRLNPDRPIPPLVAREPQVAEARATLAAAEAALADVDAEEQELEAQRLQAQSGLEQAQVNLSRAEVRLPESGGSYRVLSESVDVGQTVSLGQTLAQLYDANSLEVPVPLEDRQLQWVNVPGREIADAATAPGDESMAGSGSPATVSAEFGGRERQWPGRVDRTEGQIDPRTRLIDVVITLDGVVSQDNTARLVPGLFVSASIEGRTISNVAAIPRRALHLQQGPEGEDAVYIVEEDKLRIVPVEMVRRSGDTVYVRGLENGMAVILTRLETVSEGMAVQTNSEG